MRGDIGTWYGAPIDGTDRYRITFKSTDGILNYEGSPSACQAQLETWQNKYLNTAVIWEDRKDRQNIPAESGLKYDENKPPLDLLPPDALNEVAKVLAFGAKKYARGNYRKGLQYSRLISASLRHIMAFNAGEDKDPESNESHIAHAACCLLFLLDMQKLKPEMDDRWTK